ncbi:MAG: hypothetical protein FWG77_04585, partial [Treponema sp.]|nr:hypothetical protein [Treponema sp.]
MKKALVILILLAFVGGGLFAQTVTWNGNLHTGLGVRSIAGIDDTYWGLIAPPITAAGPRVRLQFRYTNADGNAGIDTTIQAGNTPDAWGTPAVNVGTAVGFVTFFDNMFRVQAGRFWGGQTPFAKVDNLDGDDVFYDYGIFATVYPVDMFRFGFGLNSTTLLTENAKWDDGPITAHIHARLSLAGLFNATAGLRFTPSADTSTVNADFSFNAPVIPIVDLRGFAYFNRLDDFSDAGSITGSVQVMIPYGILMEDLRLGVYTRFSISNVEANENPFFGGALWLDYRTANIFPRFEIGYATGSQFSGTHTAFGNWGALYRLGPAT